MTTRREFLLSAASASLLPVLPARAGEDDGLSPLLVWFERDGRMGGWQAGDFIGDASIDRGWTFDGEQWVEWHSRYRSTTA